MLTVFRGVESFLVNYGYVFEIGLAIALFACYFERRRWFLIRAVGCCVLILICYRIFYIFSFRQSFWLGLFSYFLIYVLFYFSVLFCFRISGWIGLYVLSGANAAQHIAFRFYSVVLSFLGAGFEEFRSGILIAAIIALVYTAVFFSFRSQLKNAVEKPFKSRANIVLGLAIFTAAIVIYRFESSYNFMVKDPFINLLFALYAILANIFSLALLYRVFHSNKMTDDMAMLENVISRQNEQYRIMKENIDNVNIKCHDMKQQISMFENRIDQDALQEIKSIINVYDTTFKTGNEVLDVFLQEKLLSCERDLIKLDCIVDGQSVDFIKPPDLYTLVGNAIDNAIEAVKKIENPEKRIISLSIRRNLNMVLMHIDNEYVGNIEMTGGLPKSIKGDDFNHGFGMRSMRLIAEKYKGTLSVALQGTVFNLNILIPIQPGEPSE